MKRDINICENKMKFLKNAKFVYYFVITICSNLLQAIIGSCIIDRVLVCPQQTIEFFVDSNGEI